MLRKYLVLIAMFGLGWNGSPLPAQTSASEILTQRDGLPCDPQRGAWIDYDKSGCCGAPGTRSCALILHPGKGPGGSSYGCTDPPSNILRYTPYDGSNFYCQFAAPQPESVNLLPAGRPPSGTNFTFAVTSDLHFYRDTYYFPNQVLHPGRINYFVENPPNWPSTAPVNNLFGKMQPPVAVIIPGDISTGPDSLRMGAYRLLWERGWTPESIRVPVYPGLGNHDATDGCCFGVESLPDATRMWDYVMARTRNLHADRNHTGCLLGIGNSSCVDEGNLGGSLNYSWDWQGVHLVMLHIWAGDTDTKYVPPLGRDGLKWLENDLAHHVGSSGRPVVLFQHYPFHSNDWSAADRYAFLEVIKGYNVIGLFSGHTHQMYAARKDYQGLELDNIGDGSGGDCDDHFCTGGTANFLMVHVSDRYMEVGAASWSVASPIPVFDANDGSWSSKFPGESAVCRKRINTRYTPVLASEATVQVDTTNRRIVVRNASSTSFLSGAYAVKGPFSKWDFTNRCAGDADKYLVVSESGIGAGATLSIPYAGLGAGPVVLYRLGDALVADRDPVEVGPAPVTIRISTRSGNSTGFNFSVDKTWLVVTADRTTTPAQLTVTAASQTLYPATEATITVTPLDASISPTRIRVLLKPAPVELRSNYPGVTVKLQGELVQPPYSTTKLPGTKLEVDVPAQPPAASGVRYEFLNWSDGGTRRHEVTVPLAGLNLTANFSKFDQVTYSITPPGSGDVEFSPALPADGYVREGSSLRVAAVPTAGFHFVGFEGGIKSTQPRVDVTVSGPLSFTARFAPHATITVSTNLPTTEICNVSVGTVNGPAPQSSQFPPGTSVHLNVPPMCASTTAGVRYLFQRWADGVTPPERDITAGGSNVTYQAIYSTQVQVTVFTAPPAGGSVSGGGWCDVNSDITLRALPAARYLFIGFSGGLNTTSNPATLRVGTAPLSITAQFAPFVNVTIDSSLPGLPFSVDGSRYLTPQSFPWIQGTTHTVVFDGFANGPVGTRYRFTGWPDFPSTAARPILAGTTDASYTASFTTQYLVSTVAHPPSAGSVTAGGWFDSGTSITVQATPSIWFRFVNFTGDLTGATNPATLAVTHPSSITAHFAQSVTPN